MTVDELPTSVPRWAVVALLAAVGLSFVYGVVIMGSLTAPLGLWVSIGSLALTLFVIYLLYRFVIAVETIAEKL